MFDDLVKDALAGTAQGTGEAAWPQGPLADAIKSLPESTPELALLDKAALVSGYERCGRKSFEISPKPEPCAADVRPECSRPSAAALERLLSEPQSPATKQLSNEWLHLADRAGVRIPHRLLPRVLDLAARDKTLVDAVVAVIDERGRWLTQFNPQWQFAAKQGAGDDSATIWQTGNRDQRQAVLKQLRRTDPASARGLVEATWQSDTADDRAVFIETLAEALGPADEVFLESALDDRSKRVRAAAAELLAALPSSGFSRRMADRVSAFLKFNPGQAGGFLKRGRPATLDISLPPEPFDAAWARDGMAEKPAEKIGVRQWWLRQMVAYVPLAEWTARWKTSPDECVAAAKTVAGDFGGLILEAWAQAARRSRDADWISALVLAAVENDPSRPLSLLSRLDHAGQRDLLSVLLRRGATLPMIMQLLEATDVELADSCATTVIDVLDRHVSTLGPGYDPGLAAALDALALRLPAGFAEPLSRTWGAVSWPYNDKPRERFVYLVSLRRDIQRGFAQ